jgi:hypothetical protein
MWANYHDDPETSDEGQSDALPARREMAAASIRVCTTQPNRLRMKSEPITSRLAGGTGHTSSRRYPAVEPMVFAEALLREVRQRGLDAGCRWPCVARGGAEDIDLPRGRLSAQRLAARPGERRVEPALGKVAE